MKNIYSLFCCALLVAATAGCKHKTDASAACPDVLVGTWHLTNRVCTCPTTPKQDETIIFTASQEYSVYRDGLLTAKGTYAIGQNTACNGSAMVPFLTFTPATPGAYAPDGAYTLRDCTLVINQCLVIGDAVLTYQHPVD